VVNEFHYSERQACQLISVDRTSYRYKPRPDHNAELRERLITLARQKPRYGYRRLCALLERGGPAASPQRVYRIYRAEHLAVRRLKRKHLVRPAPETTSLSRANQEWAIGLCGRWVGYRKRAEHANRGGQLHARMSQH
jgi:putative transposase